MTKICRIDPTRNMARFYVIGLQADLLGGWSVIREWGRIGGIGRVKIDTHAELADAEAAAQRLEARKRRRGYG